MAAGRLGNWSSSRELVAWTTGRKQRADGQWWESLNSQSPPPVAFFLSLPRQHQLGTKYSEIMEDIQTATVPT